MKQSAPSACGHGVLKNSKVLSVCPNIINMVLIHDKQSEGMLKQLLPFQWQQMRTRLYNDLKGEKAQVRVTNPLAFHRLYTSHLFAGDSLALD